MWSFRAKVSSGGLQFQFLGHTRSVGGGVVGVPRHQSPGQPGHAQQAQQESEELPAAAFLGHVRRRLALRHGSPQRLAVHPFHGERPRQAVVYFLFKPFHVLANSKPCSPSRACRLLGLVCSHARARSNRLRLRLTLMPRSSATSSWLNPSTTCRVNTW